MKPRALRAVAVSLLSAALLLSAGCEPVRQPPRLTEEDAIQMAHEVERLAAAKSGLAGPGLPAKSATALCRLVDFERTVPETLEAVATTLEEPEATQIRDEWRTRPKSRPEDMIVFEATGEDGEEDREGLLLAEAARISTIPITFLANGMGRIEKIDGNRVLIAVPDGWTSQEATLEDVKYEPYAWCTLEAVPGGWRVTDVEFTQEARDDFPDASTF